MIPATFKPSLLSAMRVFFALLTCVQLATTAHGQTTPDGDATYTVPGLTKPAEIIVDTYGVPHIYAQDHYDVFFVQGFNAARDRLWQIDLWRKRGLGELASVLGASYVAQDSAARLFLYRGDMYSEWLSYGNDAKKITEAFTAGINAFVDLTQQHPHLLPPEFELLKYRPSRWSPEDVVRIRSNGLWRNVTTEVWRARLACHDALEVAGVWKQLEPTWQTRVPEGLDPCLIPDDVLAKYSLAKAPVTFDAERTNLSAALQDDLNHGLGSNNWVVAPERTKTGRPILADDPHRGHATPSLRYIAHLVGPGINVIGAGEPALPGISIGHNEKIAFGLTIFPIDQEDLYVYQKGKRGYLYQGRDEPFMEVTENVAVQGAESQPITLQFTRHGPVVATTKTHIFVVRAAWLEPGMSPYFGSIEYMRAQNWREFVGALNRWGAPSENQVYADVEGNIGYKPAGRFPVRHNWDGLLPVPGDGRYEWQGYFDMDVLPEEHNPERGFTGTANSMNLPDDYPIDKYRIGFEWSSPWRYKRLWEVLAAQNHHTLKDSLDLQRDYQSVLARRVLALLPDLADYPAGELLRTWDHVLTPESPAAAFWNVWYTRHLTPQLGKLVINDITVPQMALDPLTVLSLLETEKGRAAAYASLADGWRETHALLGQTPENWRWGDLHRIKFQHPLEGLAPDSLRAQMLMPDYPRGGNANTTNNTGFRSKGFDVVSGASFRMVVDVGNWDNAYATNAPGQSGDPRSRFYDNLLDNWATDDKFPLLYSRTAIEKNGAFSITLLPGD
jgi:penicillin G amidase